MTNKPGPSAAARAITDGRDRLGHVEQHDDGVRAFDRRGRLVGTYDTATAAIDAIIALVTKGTP